MQTDRSPSEMNENEIGRRLLQVMMRQKGSPDLARHDNQDIGRGENERPNFEAAQQPPILRTQPNHYPPMQSGHQIRRQQNFSQNAAINHRPSEFELNERPVHPGLVFDGMMAQAIRSLDGFSYTMTLNTIPNLDGSKGSESVNAFFKQFDMATEEWPEQKRLRALRSKCFGKAERAFNFAVSENRHDYQLIRTAIIRQLDDTDAKQLTSFDQLMKGVWLRPNESIDQLGERVSRLVRCAYPGLTEQLYDEYSAMHFIRALPNSELAIILEMTRQPGATFDEFIAQAARAEAVQNAARNSQRNSQNNCCSQTNWPKHGRSQNQQRHVTCYNCGRVGHIFRNCALKPMQNMYHQNDELPKRGNLFVGAVNLEHRSEIEKFFGKTTNESEKGKFFEENPAVGKILAAKVSVFGHKLDAMLDGGSQISLISAKFFSQIMGKVNLKDVISRSESRIIDINGKEVKCFGIVALPIQRGPLKAKIRVFVAQSTFGYDLLFGTNAMDQLGFKMLDAVNCRIVDFSPASKPENSPLITFKTFVCHGNTNTNREGQKRGINIVVEKKSNGNAVDNKRRPLFNKTFVPQLKTQEIPIKNSENFGESATNKQRLNSVQMKVGVPNEKAMKCVWKRKNLGQIQLGTTENLGWVYATATPIVVPNRHSIAARITQNLAKEIFIAEKSTEKSPTVECEETDAGTGLTRHHRSDAE
ncbi:hypothetical protein niasHS_011560 [Heterodera schachtii]|uniref:CCHC-type domain-containing protein n=1 Tax=Heterodera schachtii TaxID=97005 RepID=A0ABD2IVT6_HETSC